jgi:putative transposase
VRTEVTDRMLIFGERHLRRVLAGFAAHYNARRLHRALQLRPPRPDALVPTPVHGPVRRRPVLGGLISEYEPAAWNCWSRAAVDFWDPTGPSGHWFRRRAARGAI